MEVEQRHQVGEGLGQAGERVRDRLVAVRVEQRHRVADHAGRLHERTVRREALHVHVPQDPAVHRLQAVGGGRDGAVLDDLLAVGEVVAVELLDGGEVDDDLLELGGGHDALLGALRGAGLPGGHQLLLAMFSVSPVRSRNHALRASDLGPNNFLRQLRQTGGVVDHHPADGAARPDHQSQFLVVHLAQTLHAADVGLVVGVLGTERSERRVVGQVDALTAEHGAPQRRQCVEQPPLSMKPGHQV